MKKIDIVKNKKLYFIFSSLLIIPGIIFILLGGLEPSIEFSGGSRLDLSFEKEPDRAEIEKIVENNKVELQSITEKDNVLSIRTSPIESNTKTKILDEIKKGNGTVNEEGFDTVGPTIGTETQVNALKAVVIASVGIALYVAFAFRKVSKPVASWKYGICVIITLLHDVLIVLGAFAIFGFFFHVEVDSLFITALLTVMGFSVHDTIVVFDRIRENLRRNFDNSFEEVVNNSLLETLNRSVNTSLTVMITLFALLIFGGESIRWFVVALLIGMMIGTYSSIFNAAQLIVAWYERDRKKKNK